MKKFCIANWKMNLTIKESITFIDKIEDSVIKSDATIVICPAYTSIYALSEYSKNKNLNIGAQNVSSSLSGAFTGEISINMLEEIKSKYVIVGHSERRELFNDTNSEVSKKMNIVMNSNLIPILCIGERLEEKESEQTESVLQTQLNDAFSKIDCTLVKNKDILIAYEPVWSIGTGIAADIKTIDLNVKMIKNIIKSFNLNNCNLYILYGGSVNENNASSILKIKDLNGFLIGGASLKSSTFVSIINHM